MVTRYLKIATQNYMLRQDKIITKERVEELKKHPQANKFYFKRAVVGFKWYVKVEHGHYNMSTTQKEENNLLKESYKEYLSKNKFQSNLQMKQILIKLSDWLFKFTEINPNSSSRAFRRDFGSKVSHYRYLEVRE